VLPGANPFASMPQLPKPHYSWPICGIARSMAGCIRRSDRTLVDFARVTGVLPLGLDGVNIASKWDTSFDNSTLPEAVAICAEANCSLGLFYSAWNQWFPSTDPMFEGTTPMLFTAGGKRRVGSEDAEVAFWRGRLEGVASGLRAANAAQGLVGRNAVVVSAVLVDSEKFGADCPHVNCNASQQVAIQRKHDLIWQQAADIFPGAAFDAFDRGGVERFTEGDQTFDRVPEFERWHGGFDFVGGRRGDSFGIALYHLSEPVNTRQTFNATANNCDAHSAHCNASTTPWLSLGCGYRRTIDRHPGDGASAGQQHWDFGYDFEIVVSACVCVRWSKGSARTDRIALCSTPG
jgi:hypothetical protein